MSDHNRLMEQIGIGHVTTLAARFRHLFRPTSTHDKGIDGELEITSNSNLKSLILGVQIKARSDFKADANGEISITVTDQNLNYWRKYGRPVILMVYSDDRVYWKRVDNITDRRIKLSPDKIYNESSEAEFIDIVSQYVLLQVKQFPLAQLSEILDQIKVGSTVESVINPIVLKLEHAYSLVELRDYVAAAEIFNVLTLIYDNGLLWQNYIACLANSDQFQEAYNECTKQIEKNPTNVLYHFTTGMCLIDLGNFAEAEIYFNQAKALEPNEPEIWNHLGLLHYWQGKNELAFKELYQAFSLDQQNEDYLFNLALCCTALRLYKPALDFYNQCIVKNAKHYDSHNNMALLLKSFGRFWEALEHFDMAIEINSLNPYAWFNSAYLLKDLGYNERAIQRFHIVLEIEKLSEQVHLHLGVLYCRIGELPTASYHFNNARSLILPSLSKQNLLPLRILNIDAGFNQIGFIDIEVAESIMRVISASFHPELSIQEAWKDLIYNSKNINEPFLTPNISEIFTPENISRIRERKIDNSQRWTIL